MYARGDSFNTIAAYGGNGAIIHYKPTEVTSAVLGRDSMFLLDSGGQYLDGTTDVTRTFHYGQPTDFEIDAYTREQSMRATATLDDVRVRLTF